LILWLVPLYITDIATEIGKCLDDIHEIHDEGEVEAEDVKFIRSAGREKLNVHETQLKM
jgi:hypothetical protein